MEACYSPSYWKGRAQGAFHNWVGEQPVSWANTTFTCYTEPFQWNKAHGERKRYPCTIEAISTGYGQTVQALDRRYLKTSQRRKGTKLLRVPYYGGDKDSGIPYHIHSLIELPQGVPIEELRAYTEKIFLSVMERELSSDGRFKVKASVWCEPYGDDEKFLQYCGRFEGASLSVGLDKVVFPHLIMNPPVAGRAV